MGGEYYLLIEYMILELFCVSLCAIAYLLYSAHLKSSQTAVSDLDDLGTPRPLREKLDGTAVVCGGSIAGLWTARVCADHFSRVVVVDPEVWEEGTGEPRKHKRARVPQYTSLHGYQPFSLLALRKLFPTFDQEVQRTTRGYIAPYNLRLHHSGIPLLYPFASGRRGEDLPEVMYMRRAAYETLLRRLVMIVCGNVEFVTGRVVGVERAGGRVGGVEIRMGGEGAVVVVPAALVVDCTGPSRSALRWLQQPSPPRGPTRPSFSNLKQTYDAKMHYTTCEFRLTPNCSDILPHDSASQGGNYYVFQPSAGREKKSWGVARMDVDHLTILCGGWDYRDRIRSVSDIRGYLSTLVTDSPVPGWIFRLLDVLEGEELPVTYAEVRVPASVYVRYHLCPENLPSNFIAIGDSVLQLNPIRGQGCTKACVEAVSLDALLRKCPNGTSLPPTFGRDFFALQATRTGRLWDATRLDDYGWGSTTPMEGETLEHGRLFRGFNTVLVRLVQTDEVVARTFLRVSSWMEPPAVLVSPVIVFKVLVCFVRARIGV